MILLGRRYRPLWKRSPQPRGRMEGKMDELDEWHSRCDQNLYAAEMALMSASAAFCTIPMDCWRIRDLMHDALAAAAAAGDGESDDQG